MLSLNFVLERALLQNTGGCQARRQILYLVHSYCSYQLPGTAYRYILRVRSSNSSLFFVSYNMLGKIRLLNGRKSKISKGERVGMILILRFGSSPDENRKFQKGERVGMILISSLRRGSPDKNRKFQKCSRQQSHVVSSRF